MRPQRSETNAPKPSSDNVHVRREVKITVPVNGARVTLRKTIQVLKPDTGPVEEDDPIVTPIFTQQLHHAFSSNQAPLPELASPIRNTPATKRGVKLRSPPSHDKSTDKRLVTANRNSPVKLYRAKGLGSASSIAKSPDRRLVSATRSSPSKLRIVEDLGPVSSLMKSMDRRLITANRNSPAKLRSVGDLDSASSFARSTDRRLITANRNLPVPSPRTPKTSRRLSYDGNPGRSVRRRISLGNSAAKASGSKCDSMSPAIYSLESGGLLSDHKPLTMDSVRTRSQSYHSPPLSIEFPSIEKTKNVGFNISKDNADVERRYSIDIEPPAPICTPEVLEKTDRHERTTRNAYVPESDLGIVEKEPHIEACAPVEVKEDRVKGQEKELNLNKKVRRALSPPIIVVLESPDSLEAVDCIREREVVDEIESGYPGSAAFLSSQREENWSDIDKEAVEVEVDEISEASKDEVEVMKAREVQELSFDVSDGECSTEPPSPIKNVEGKDSEGSKYGFAMACRPIYVTIPAGALRSPKTPDSN